MKARWPDVLVLLGRTSWQIQLCQNLPKNGAEWCGVHKRSETTRGLFAPKLQVSEISGSRSGSGRPMQTV